MTSPYNAEGHQDLREYITSADGWRYLSVVDDSGSEVTRIDILNDSRVSWSDAASNPLEAVMTVSASDTDIGPLPVTIAGSELYLSDTATTAMHDDTFDADNVTLDSGQQIELVHSIEQPEI